MAAKVVYYGTDAVDIGYPVANETPAAGITKDFWEKITIDFSKKHLVADDWADFYEIPERMFIYEMFAVVKEHDGQDNELAIADVDSDDNVEWIDNIDDSAIDNYTIINHNNTNGAVGGKFYPAGGNLYISAVAATEVDATILDVYIHAIMLD